MEMVQTATEINRQFGYPGRQHIQKVTTITELEKVLRVLNLPGFAPAEFLIIQVEMSENGTYMNDDGGDDEWSLTWTKVNEPTIEMER